MSNNVFINMMDIINKMNESRSTVNKSKEEERHERKMGVKVYRPKHTKILMREKSADEYNKLAKEVKYKSFLGLDEYDKSNAIGNNRLGISKDASITRFAKKKKAKNLHSYIPQAGVELDIMGGGSVINNFFDNTSVENFKNSDLYLDRPVYNPYDDFSMDNYITNRLSGDRFSEYAEDNPMKLISLETGTMFTEKNFIPHILEMIKAFEDGGLDEESANEITGLAFDLSTLKLIERYAYADTLDYIVSVLKSIYILDLYSFRRTNELDAFYGIDIDTNVPLLQKQCPKLPVHHLRYISSCIKDLTTYSNHAEIREKYMEVFHYLMGTCAEDESCNNLTVEELFDYFTLIVAVKYQAMVMADVATLPTYIANDISDTVRGELVTLVRNYIEFLPTKVETLFMYLDNVYSLRHDLDERIDLLNILPLEDWLEKQYPATYSMLQEIAKKVTQYKELF